VVGMDEGVEGRSAKGVRGHGWGVTVCVEHKSRLERLIKEGLLWFTAWDT